MKLHELSPAKGSKRNRKRIGRGPGSGLGKTAGRGHKGQRSRSGYSQRLGFRVPKRGFTNIFQTRFQVVNLSSLGELGAEITPEILVEKGLVRAGQPIKILGEGDLAAPATVHAHKFSASARAKIEAAGGTCEVLES
jgi:large subunit ribosomal protein L15